jgi:hypothetical protein
MEKLLSTLNLYLDAELGIQNEALSITDEENLENNSESVFFTENSVEDSQEN